jgi:hypothetical protein
VNQTSSVVTFIVFPRLLRSESSIKPPSWFLEFDLAPPLWYLLDWPELQPKKNTKIFLKL